MQRGRVSTGSEGQKPHGNTANDSPATLYQKVDKNDNYLKTGVTGNTRTRYTKQEMAGGKLKTLETGPRKEMLKKERKIVEENPGPENHEPWAGKAKQQK